MYNLIMSMRQENSVKKDLSLYIHIPFCNSKCNYCAFVSKVGTEAEKLAYIKDLLAEIKMRAQEYREYFKIASIYIGGGTPSSLNNFEIRDILGCIYKNFSVKNSAEITIEVNPNTVTKTKIREYILAGINRFSIGFQCANPKVLSSMGRTHSLQDFVDTVNNIRDQGISNISADIIIGYPGQTLKDVDITLKHLLDLNVPHISCYMLQVEENTKLKALVDKGVSHIVAEEKLVNMYNHVLNTLKSNGYNRYELSNFAKPGFMCYHNNVYWNRTDYLGFGVSAHSYVSGVRFSNTENLPEYSRCINVLGKPPVKSANELTINEKKEEFVMLSLRTEKGLDTKAYEAEFGEKFMPARKSKIASLITNGFITLDPNGTIKATDKGFLVLNRLIYELV